MYSPLIISTHAALLTLHSFPTRRSSDLYYKGTGPSREKLRDLLQTILYNPAFLTDDVFEERYQASIDPETVELFGKKQGDRKSTRLNSSHSQISYAVFCLKKKKKKIKYK